MLRLFQNPVGFETTSWKSGQMPTFPGKSKVAVPKTEVLEQPLFTKPDKSALRARPRPADHQSLSTTRRHHRPYGQQL
jgi:hypothetical protein